MCKWVAGFATVGCVAAVLFGMASKAAARPNYNTAFGKKYAESGTIKALGKANCNICHVGENKKKRNDYGAAVGKALGAAKVEVAAEVEKALDDAAKMHSKPDDDKSPTFGDLIKDGTLPITK